MLHSIHWSLSSLSLLVKRQNITTNFVVIPHIYFAAAAYADNVVNDIELSVDVFGSVMHAWRYTLTLKSILLCKFWYNLYMKIIAD